jgi:hypothetical protein
MFFFHRHPTQHSYNASHVRVIRTAGGRRGSLFAAIWLRLSYNTQFQLSFLPVHSMQVAGAARCLRRGGKLITYGPYKLNGQHTGAHVRCPTVKGCRDATLSDMYHLCLHGLLRVLVHVS